MNQELFQMYVKGLLNGWFNEDSTADGCMPDEFYFPMSRLEKESGIRRRDNPEFRGALEVLESPLMKALK